MSMIGRVLTIVALGLGAVATLCVVFLWKGIMVDRVQAPQNQDDTFSNIQERKDADIPVLPSMTRDFSYEPANISFTLPEGWEHLSLADAPQLLGFNTSGFALSNEKEGCYLVYYDQDIDKDIYAQTGFGERTFAGEIQFDNQWYAPQEVLPEDFTFDFDKPQRFPREIYALGIFYGTPTFTKAPQLILFEREGTVIPDVCIADMKALTESWKPYFKATTLSQKSSGYLYATTQPGAVSSGVSHIFFKSDDGSAPQVLTQSPAQWGRTMTFRADGTIEGVTKNGTLSRFNIFSGSTTNSQPLLPTGEVLTYYRYAADEWVLGAASMSCLDGGNCKSTLYKKDSDGAFKVVSGGTLNGPTGIVGYAPEKKQLILSSGYGDAGCSRAELYIYDVTKKSVTRTLKYSGCLEEPDTPEQVKTRLEMDNLREAAGIKRQSHLLRVERGIVSITDASQVREAMSGALFVEDYSL